MTRTVRRRTRTFIGSPPSSPLRFVDPTGTDDRSVQRPAVGDVQVEKIADFLQEVADEFLETALRHRPGEAANVFGTRMHDILQGVTESARFNAPGVAVDRILTEVIIDKSGTITAFGGKPGGAPAESVTVDVVILNKGVSSTDAIVGRKAKDVLTAGIDYKTGDARLAQHQREFFEKIDKPLFKLKVGGNLLEEMLGATRLPRARPTPAGRSGRGGQAGFITPELAGTIAQIGALVLLQALLTGEAPSVQDMVRIGMETRFPIVGLMEARTTATPRFRSSASSRPRPASGWAGAWSSAPSAWRASRRPRRSSRRSAGRR